MRRLLALALLAAIATPLVGQAPMAVPGRADISAVSGGTYRSDPDHTLIAWTVDHMGFTPYTGIFGGTTGTLEIDPQKPGSAKVDVTIPVARVTTANAALTQHLLRPGQNGGKPDFFGPAPTDARFVSTAVIIKGRTARIAGNLTLNGITRPVTLEASFYGAGKLPPEMGGGENVGFRASGSIRRSEFGLATGIPLVSDEVRLEIAAAFQKAV